MPKSLRSSLPKPITFRVAQDAREFLPVEDARLAECLNLFQDRIINLRVQWHVDAKTQSYSTVKRSYLDNDLTRQMAARVIDFVRSNPQLFETNGYWIQGEQSIGYRFGPGLANRETVRVECKDAWLIARLNANDRAEDKRFTKAQRWLKRCLRDSFTLVYDEAIAAAAGVDYPDLARQCLDLLNDGAHNVSVCEQRRVHGTHTRTPAALRPFFRIDGEPVVWVDVPNSQPLILGAVCLRDLKESNLSTPSSPTPTRWQGHQIETRKPLQEQALRVELKTPEIHTRVEPPEDLVRYLSLCQQGRLYHHLMAKVAWTSSKRDFKDCLWFPFLYGPNRSETRFNRANQRLAVTKDLSDEKHLPEQQPRRLAQLIEAFTHDFPTILNFMTAAKSNDYAKLACDMQKTESDIVIEGAVGRLAAKRVPCFAIHDAIGVARSALPAAIEALKYSFAEYGVAPFFDVSPSG